jgi:hypothetical protein
MRTFRAGMPSPALVISIVALVVALGGTSYAAFSLPRGSVGAEQLRKNSVTTSAIRNGAVTGSKIAKRTITAKQVNLAALGTVPSASSAGTAITANTANTANQAINAANLGGSPASAYQQKVLWARVAPDGTLTASSGATSSGLLATGDYEVIFNRPVTGCAYEATIGSSVLSNDTFNDAGAGLIYTEPRKDNPNGVFVATFAPAITKTNNVFATPADNAFHLAVMC